jgi:hypothetical protein
MCLEKDNQFFDYCHLGRILGRKNVQISNLPSLKHGFLGREPSPLKIK